MATRLNIGAHAIGILCEEGRLVLLPVNHGARRPITEFLMSQAAYDGGANSMLMDLLDNRGGIRYVRIGEGGSREIERKTQRVFAEGQRTEVEF